MGQLVFFKINDKFTINDHPIVIFVKIRLNAGKNNRNYKEYLKNTWQN